MKMKRVILALMVSSIVILTMFHFTPELEMRVFATGDAIAWVSVEEYNGTDWNLMLNTTLTGQTVRILDSQLVNFTTCVKLDKTYAATASEAVSYTIVVMNVTWGGTNFVTQFNNYTCSNCTAAQVTSDASFWYVYKWGNWTSELPVAGRTYTWDDWYAGYY